MYEFKLWEAFLQYVKANGGCTDVKFWPPGTDGYTRHPSSSPGCVPGKPISVGCHDGWVTIPFTADAMRALAQVGAKAGDYGPEIDVAELKQLRELASKTINYGEDGMPAQPKFGPSPQQVIEADKVLSVATPESLAGGEMLWDAHRSFLGGKSSVGQAQLPFWEQSGVVPKAAHVRMFQAAQFPAPGVAADRSHRPDLVTAALNPKRVRFPDVE